MDADQPEELLSVMTREGRMTQFGRMLEFSLTDPRPSVSFTLLSERQAFMTKYRAAEMVIDLLSTQIIAEPAEHGSPARVKVLKEVLNFGRQLLQQLVAARVASAWSCASH